MAGNDLISASLFLFKLSMWTLLERLINGVSVKLLSEQSISQLELSGSIN